MRTSKEKHLKAPKNNEVCCTAIPERTSWTKRLAINWRNLGLLKFSLVKHNNPLLMLT